MEEHYLSRTVKFFILSILLTAGIYSSNAHSAISYNGRCDYITFLGDSNTSLWYLRANLDLQRPYLKMDYRYTDIINRKLSIPVNNYGRGGAKTEDLLPGQRYSQWINQRKESQHGVYVISFGLNDHKQFKNRFNENWNLALRHYYAKTRLLIQQVQRLGGTPVLMTIPAVDYPKHHHYNRNTIIDRYNQIYRNLSKNMQVSLFDINSHTRSLFKKNIWDIYIRNTAYTQGVYVLDSSQDQGRRNANWYSNIHYNLNGSKHVAEFLLGRLKSMGCRESNRIRPNPSYITVKKATPPVITKRKYSPIASNTLSYSIREEQIVEAPAPMPTHHWFSPSQSIPSSEALIDDSYEVLPYSDSYKSFANRLYDYLVE